MVGKERMFVATLVALAIGSALAAVATSIELMILARVIQGIGGAVLPLAFGIIRDEFPRERVAGAIGLISALLGVGGGAGVVLAGPIVDNLSFHYLFWLPLIPLVLATVLIHLFVPESPVRVPGKVNWAGAALMSAGLSAVLVAVAQSPVWHWLSAKTLGVLAAAKEMGLRVPEDLSIVGYDNTHLAALNQISLTSVDQPRRAMGRSAAALLSDRISGPGKPSRLREVSPSLVVRTSSGPAPE